MRQPTPGNILDATMPALGYDLAGAMTAAPVVDLYFDYAQFGEAGPAIRDHAIAIKLTRSWPTRPARRWCRSCSMAWSIWRTGPT